MRNYILLLAIGFFIGCSPSNKQTDTPKLTPKETFLILDISYGTSASVTWNDFEAELSSLEKAGLIKRLPNVPAGRNNIEFPSAELTRKGEQIVIMLKHYDEMPCIK